MHSRTGATTSAIRGLIRKLKMRVVVTTRFLFSSAKWIRLKRCRHAAIDIENVSVDEVRSRTREEYCRAHQVLDITPTPRRCAPDEPCAKGFVFHERFGQFGLEVAWSEPIHLDTVLAPVDRHALRQHFHRAFCRRVRSNVGATQF